MAKKRIDLDLWHRKAHYNFFSRFEEPFFGICTEVDVTQAYRMSKALQVSFFLYYLHRSLVAANDIVSFRYRIEEGAVYEYDQIHASPTINRADGTFGFGYMDYYPDFDLFRLHATKEIESVQQQQGLELSAANANIIHFSSIPWIRFTALSHARAFSFPDCIPKISFGKMTETGGKRMMPVSVHAHHALMDGYDVGLFLEHFQSGLDDAG